MVPARPVVPPLVVGGEQPRSFIISGAMRSAGTAGIGFHIATDGQRELTAVYDLTDGTPLYLSDGSQTLVYDVANSRLVRVPTSRGGLKMDWNADAPKPLSFHMGIHYSSNPDKLDEDRPGIRLDRFVRDTEQFMVDSTNGIVRYRTIGGDSTRRIEQDPSDPSWFRFGSRSAGAPYDHLLLEARLIDRPIPNSSLVFPKFDALPDSLRPVDAAGGAPAAVSRLSRNDGWILKMVLNSGSDGDVQRLVPDADIKALRERDAVFGSALRSALAEQGLELSPQPTTQPLAP